MPGLDAESARIHAALIGYDFDAQDDYCEPCRAYHVGETHDEAVPNQCGAVGVWGFSAVNDCRRETDHPDRHSDINGTEWA